jgi:hypothetical protein
MVWISLEDHCSPDYFDLGEGPQGREEGACSLSDFIGFGFQDA